MKNSQKGFIVPLIIAIVVILIAGGAYLAYKNEKGQTEQAEQTNNQFLASTTVNTNAGTNIIQASSSANVVTASTSTKSIIQLMSPTGGQMFNDGQKVSITWKNNLYYPSVIVELVGNTLDKCHEYTNNGSMGTCRSFLIYSGANIGSFSWVVREENQTEDQSGGSSEYPNAGTYIIRILPSISSVETTGLIAQGYSVDAYSGFITLTPLTGSVISTTSVQTSVNGNNTGTVQTTQTTDTLSQTYTNNQFGFSIEYPILGNTFIPTGSNNIGIKWQNNSGPDEGNVYINVQQLNTSNGCNTNFSNGTQVTINGIKFSKDDVSSNRLALLTDISANLLANTKIYANEYCVVRNSFVYRLTSLMDLSSYASHSGYTVPSYSDFENNTIINQIIDSFKFTN